jgi:hypothetical protein
LGDRDKPVIGTTVAVPAFDFLHFLSPKFRMFGVKREFFNSHACSQQLS